MRRSAVAGACGSAGGGLDARIERMGIAPLECEESCSSIGINRYTVGLGVEAIRSTHGGMLLSLKAMRLADVSAIVISIGGYVHP
jgi:hypothetical protein